VSCDFAVDINCKAFGATRAFIYLLIIRKALIYFAASDVNTCSLYGNCNACYGVA
jgi:hypothetical protein